jgi:hypothetical protein
MAGDDAVTIEYQYEAARWRGLVPAPAAQTDLSWRGLIKIGVDDDVAIRWWASRGRDSRAPGCRR